MAKRCLFAALCLLFASSLYAEEKEAAKLEEIVVTATRTEKEASTAPGNVKVVTKKDIEKRSAQTVDSVLNTLPGVFNRRANLMDTLSAVTLGGIPGQNRTLILKDGVPLNNAYTGDVSLTSMSAGDVERIEVVQGPFSSLYGGYAMGGVVNILTKMPEKREFTVKSGYGSSWNRGESLDDLYKYYLSYGDKPTEKLRLFFSYGYKATNGYPKDMVVASKKPTAGITGWTQITDKYGATSYLIGDKGDNTWWDDNINIKAGYDFSNVSKLGVSFMRTRYKYNYDEPHTYLTNAAGDNVYSYGTVGERSYTSGSGLTATNIYNVNYETEIYGAKAKIVLGLNDQTENWYTTPNTTSKPYATLSGLNGKVSSSPNETYYADLQATVPLFNRHILTVGGSYRAGRSNTEEHSLTYYKDEDSKTGLTYNSGGKDTTYAVFVQDEILLHRTLTAYIGFRQDWWKTYDGYANQYGSGAFANSYDSRTDSSFSPKASLVYKPFEETTFRTSAGRSFRAPTMYELYRTWVSSTNITYNGNPDLTPETVTSWDAGITQGLWKGAKVSVTYFENYLKDMIYRKTVTATQSDCINAGKAESKGVMLEAEQRFDKCLRLFSNFTYTDARIKENNAKPTTVDKRLTYLPDKMFNAGAELEIGPVSTSLTGRYVGKRYTDDENKDTVSDVPGSYDSFFTMDAKVSWKINQYATMSFSVDNLANESHYESYRAPGRLLFGELELRL
jgi:iron complex outermembrane receptor protein